VLQDRVPHPQRVTLVRPRRDDPEATDDHALLRGPFAGAPAAIDADGAWSSWTNENAYGVITSRFVDTKTKTVQRASTFCGREVEQPWPRAAALLACFAAHDTLSDWDACMEVGGLGDGGSRTCPLSPRAAARCEAVARRVARLVVRRPRVAYFACSPGGVSCLASHRRNGHHVSSPSSGGSRGAQYNVHANVHAWIGGAWSCASDFGALSAAKPDMHPGSVLDFVGASAVPLWDHMVRQSPA